MPCRTGARERERERFERRDGLHRCRAAQEREREVGCTGAVPHRSERERGRLHRCDQLCPQQPREMRCRIGSRRRAAQAAGAVPHRCSAAVSRARSPARVLLLLLLLLTRAGRGLR